jgi:hypothetical protein
MTWLLEDPLERAACYMGMLAHADAVRTLTLCNTTAEALAESWRQALRRGTGPKRRQHLVSAIGYVSPALCLMNIPGLIAIYNSEYQQHLEADGPRIIAEWVEVERLRDIEGGQ